MKSTLIPLLGLLALTTALPSPSSSNRCAATGATGAISITASQISSVAPKSSSCDGADFPEECATADQAAKALSSAFTKYKLSSKSEQAAVLGLIAMESGEFRYNKNHFPGVEGQGTRNMQSPDFNKLYAASIESLADRFEAVKDQPGAVLDLLLEDSSVDFGSGAWFLTTQCEDSVREGLKSGSEDGWKGFITGCVGTEANDQRKSYWQKAVEALGK
ncbi:hypothetical protein BDV18DRAFT_148545 [Aspergillus unguis]